MPCKSPSPRRTSSASRAYMATAQCATAPSIPCKALSGHRGHLHLLLNLLLEKMIADLEQKFCSISAIIFSCLRNRSQGSEPSEKNHGAASCTAEATSPVFLCFEGLFELRLTTAPLRHYAGSKYKQIESTETSRLPNNFRIPFRVASPPS